MMDQTVHVYIHHLRFLWYTFFFALDLWPLARKLHSLTHSLTHLQPLSSVLFPFLHVFQFIHLFSCQVAANSHYKIKGTLRREYLLVIHDWLASHITLFQHHLFEKSRNIQLSLFFFPPPALSGVFRHSTLLHPSGFTVTHRGQRGLLICAIDFPIGSAPHLVNENMLCAGNKTWRLRCPKMCFTHTKKKSWKMFHMSVCIDIFPCTTVLYRGTMR